MQLTKPANYRDYNDLLELMQKNKSGNNYDYQIIEKAYKFAEQAHANQRRVSGLPYILHPTSVACILTELGMDTESIVAALLHDVVEDTDATHEDIVKLFGETIANLIDGVTKISKIKYSTREECQAESIRKMLIAMSNDIRVIIIKLSDRLHNMRTMECMPDYKRRYKSLETMEIYAPIAHRLGIKAVKEELEDLSIRYLDPIGYAEIENDLELSANERQNFLDDIQNIIKAKASEYVPNLFISSRIKSVHSIYRKTYMRNKTIDQIFDIYAVRVIVDTVNDCYNILGVIHDIFTPLPGRFKDYISTPKANMYQSLHTTVIDKRGIPFEVQIRTWEMHYTAEYGIAAHWKYKNGIKGNKKETSFDEHLKWIRQMIENQIDTEDSTDLVRSIKNDLSPHEVFVFTPKGDIISLPYGSTVIDMAYAIHTGVGNRMVGAKANKRIVPIDYQVKNGEIIEILTSKEETGPKRDWLNIVKTSGARSKIRAWFKREKREENIIQGKDELDKELRKNNMSVPEKDMEVFLDRVMQKQHCDTLDDFYASIGYGGIQVWKLIPRLKEDYANLYPAKVEAEKAEKVTPEIKPVTYRNKINSGVIVGGMDDVLVKFSHCCNALPGDEIIGYITRGYGVSIHKRDCVNVPKDISKSAEPERWVSVNWADNFKSETFQSTLEIFGADRTGLLADVTIQLSTMHISIHSLNSRETGDGYAHISVTIEVNGIEHIKAISSKLKSIEGIISIDRK